jgi:hypothetical protein
MNITTTKGKTMNKVFAPTETEAYMAARAAYDLEMAARKAARKPIPRRKRVAQPLYGDMACFAAFNGITTDGTGRKAK